MLRRYWAPIAALVFLAFMAWATAPVIIHFHAVVCKAPHADNRRSETYEKPYYSNSDPHVLERIARALEAINTNGESADKTQHDLDDLIAQQDVACWGGWMLFISVVQAIIGVFGFAALVATIWQGRDGLKIARETARQELRAYVSPTGISYDDPIPDHPFSMRIKYKNHGQTPCHNVLYGSESVIINKGEAAPSWSEPGKLIKAPALLPGADRSFDDAFVDLQTNRDILVTPDMIHGLMGRNATIYVWGIIRYTDIFHADHWSKFRWKITGKYFIERTAQTCEEGNEMDIDPKPFEGSV